jgi:hypothetical protein
VLLRDATHTNKFSTLLQSYVCLHVYLCLPECSPSPAFVCFLWRSHMVCARICIRNQHSMMNIAEIVCRCTHFDESRHTSVARESTIGGAAKVNILRACRQIAFQSIPNKFLLHICLCSSHCDCFISMVRMQNSICNQRQRVKLSFYVLSF